MTRPPTTVVPARERRTPVPACYAGPGCPCHHDPASSTGGCDHGWTTRYDRQAKCETCRRHAEERAARKAAR